MDHGSFLRRLLQDVLPPVAEFAAQASPPALAVGLLAPGRRCLARRCRRGRRGRDLGCPLLTALPLLTTPGPVAPWHGTDAGRRLDCLRWGRWTLLLTRPAQGLLQQ